MGVSTTALLASGRNYYDIIITSGVGTVTKVYEGTAMVTATVSA